MCILSASQSEVPVILDTGTSLATTQSIDDIIKPQQPLHKSLLLAGMLDCLEVAGIIHISLTFEASDHLELQIMTD